MIKDGTKLSHSPQGNIKLPNRRCSIENDLEGKVRVGKSWFEAADF